MAKVLTTKGSAAELEDLIWKANSNIYLISFSFIISQSFILRLKQASDKGVNIHIVYGKSINYDAISQLTEIKNVKIYKHRNLHAKLFINETKCIIGSMNFSEFSEYNNTEIGVLLTKKDDEEAYSDALLHALDIKDNAFIEFDSTEDIDIPMGYCIRTGKRIPLNHEKPLSYEAYLEWDVWQNAHYEEKYCHFSGEPSNGETSKANPILKKYWKLYQQFLQTHRN